jgi:hypothetical protein
VTNQIESQQTITHNKMPGNIVPEVLEVPLPSEARTRLAKPLEYSGLLDSYQNADLTPVIGREYHGLQVADVLAAKTGDDLIRDIAVTGQSDRLTSPYQILTDLDSLAAWCDLLARPGCDTATDASIHGTPNSPLGLRKY